jgi:quinol monooxygenase YgiN
MLVASIGFRAQPHKRSEILSAVDETVAHMRRADGCARCRLLVDAEDANTFVMVSEWQSIAQADTYFNSRDFQIFRGIRILFRDEPVMTLDELQGRVVRLIRGR